MQRKDHEHSLLRILIHSISLQRLLGSSIGLQLLNIDVGKTSSCDGLPRHTCEERSRRQNNGTDSSDDGYNMGHQFKHDSDSSIKELQRDCFIASSFPSSAHSAASIFLSYAASATFLKEFCNIRLHHEAPRHSLLPFASSIRCRSAY